MKNIQHEITPINEDDLFIILNHPKADFGFLFSIFPTYLLSRRTCVFEEWGMLGAVREIV